MRVAHWRVVASPLRFVSGLLAAWLLPALAGAQQLNIRVVDDRGDPVPFAVVTAAPGGTRSADDAGHVTFRTSERGDILLRVRRLGFRPAEQTVRRGDTVTVLLQPLARTIGTVHVTERVSTPLSRAGYYDRMQRVQRGAIMGHFITPEELEERHPMTLGRALDGARYVLVRQLRSGKMVLTGRGGCSMTIVVDGSRVDGTLQDVEVFADPTSIDQGGSSASRDRHNFAERMDANALVGGAEITAIEVYPSTANAPAELQGLGGRGSCGIVAIWTGGRH